MQTLDRHSPRRQPSRGHGVNHVEGNTPEPEPLRRLLVDGEFIRDCFAIVGQVASYSSQIRAVAIVTVSSGTLISCGRDIGLLIDGDGDQVTGHIAKLKIDDDRRRHGPAWTAITRLLDRQ